MNGAAKREARLGCCRMLTEKRWIPAFAGMTGRECVLFRALLRQPVILGV
jgi:hypothetical protein